MNTIESQFGNPSNVLFDSNINDDSGIFPSTSSLSLSSCIPCPYYTCNDSLDTLCSSNSTHPPIKVLLSPSCTISEDSGSGLTQDHFESLFPNIKNHSTNPNTNLTECDTNISMSSNRSVNVNTSTENSCPISMIPTAMMDSAHSPSLSSSFTTVTQNVILPSSPNFYSTQTSSTPLNFQNTSFSTPQNAILYSSESYNPHSIHPSVSKFSTTEFNPNPMSTIPAPLPSAEITTPSSSSSSNSISSFTPSPPSSSLPSSSSHLILNVPSSSRSILQPNFFADPPYLLTSSGSSLVPHPDFISPPSAASTHFQETDVPMCSSSYSTPSSYSSNDFMFLPNPSCHMLEEKNVDPNRLQCQHCWKELKALQLVCRHHELEIENLQTLAGKYLERYKSLLNLTTSKGPFFEDLSN
ncbi:hypothetical protein HMI56_004872, partial [Coelomomyces lativittatus]